MGMRFMKLIW